MGDNWNGVGDGAPVASELAPITLVEGSAFCISSRSGDILPGTPQGLFFRDIRLLSRLELRVNGLPPEPLAATTQDPFSAVHVCRSRPRIGKGDSTLLVFRYRYVGRGMREDLVVHNYGEEPAFCSLELAIDADFAEVVDVREGSVVPTVARTAESHKGSIAFRTRRGSTRRGATVTFSEPATVEDGVAVFEFIVPAQGEWSACVQVTASIDGDDVEPRYRCGEPVDRAMPAERMARWRRDLPAVDSDHDGVRSVVARSAEDLGALRIFDPDHPERTVVAAGAPWFMGLFGRDSILTAWMALLVDPDLALGVLQTLARFQGKDVNPRTEEQPGRILRELRLGETSTLGLEKGRIHYGSADATPLFVMLLGEVRRWGLAREAVDHLLPAADAAIEWLERWGDSDGDGYVECQRSSDRGPVHQGWKDSPDGVRFANGALARGPVALAEVQAYTYGAYVSRAHFALEAGDAATAERYRSKAADLKARFNRDFWVDDRGWLAMGLDGDKRQVDALASNMGHCLWAGILDEDKAAVVAERLLAPEMFSGWGVRTLASSMVGYNPVSYHCGSVWPQDNAIAAAGLMRYGFAKEALRVTMALLDVALASGGRLPELFGGLDRDVFSQPVGYPTACLPQAGASASPLLLLRTMLRLDPYIPNGLLWLDPVLPDGMRRLRVDRIPLAGRRVSVQVEGGDVDVQGLPPDVELVQAPRSPITSV